VRATRPDVVYAWLDETAVFLAPICRALRIPCLVARRNLVGSNMERRYPLLAVALHRAERQALIVTANSAAVARQCIARGHRAASVRTIPNGHEVLPALAAPPNGPVRFGYVARFRPEKGHRRLMDVLERMPKGEWRVDLAGEGPLRDEIEQRVRRADLERHVRFLGPVSDVRSFWRERHIALLLSDTEGMPNALLEAGFAGRPAIGTDTGGIPEVVGDGGIIVPLHDPDRTVAAMTALVADGERRVALGERAWEHVSRRYAMARMVDAHVAAIDEALELGSSRGRRWR
jgi:glycosyltransferase involved in cell wall biosynthesis